MKLIVIELSWSNRVDKHRRRSVCCSSRVTPMNELFAHLCFSLSFTSEGRCTVLHSSAWRRSPSPPVASYSNQLLDQRNWSFLGNEALVAMPTALIYGRALLSIVFSLLGPVERATTLSAKASLENSLVILGNKAFLQTQTNNSLKQRRSTHWTNHRKNRNNATHRLSTVCLRLFSIGESLLRAVWRSHNFHRVEKRRRFSLLANRMMRLSSGDPSRPD